MKKEIKRKKLTVSGSSKTKKVSGGVKKIKDAEKYIPQDSRYWEERTINDEHRDWDYDEESWVKDYVTSSIHPHRNKILSLLHEIPWSYLLEVGCASGPNLRRIRSEFP